VLPDLKAVCIKVKGILTDFSDILFKIEQLQYVNNLQQIFTPQKRLQFLEIEPVSTGKHLTTAFNQIIS